MKKKYLQTTLSIIFPLFIYVSLYTYGYTQIIPVGTLHVPLVGITSVPSPMVLPEGGGKVTYLYAVKSFLEDTPLSDVSITDSVCKSAVFTEGDDNKNTLLDYDETWRFRCVSQISETTLSIATVVGTANNITVTHQAYTTVVVGSDVPPPLVSIINITKVAYPLSLPPEGGKVTFTYKVNNPGEVSLAGVRVIDDKCKAMSSKLGDTNGNEILDLSEVWIYTCNTILTETTTNTVNVSGSANGLTAVGSATITIKVATTTGITTAIASPTVGFAPRFPAQPIPSSPLLGPSLDLKIIIWSILIIILVLVTLFYGISQRNRSGNKVRKYLGFTIVIPALLLSGIVIPVWLYLARSLPDVQINTAFAPVSRLFGWEFPVAKFPLTGNHPTRLAYSSIRDPGGIAQGLPLLLTIPSIGVESMIEDAFITPDGRMDVPIGSENVAWFALGPTPGKEGSAVIGGHYGIQDGKKFVFYDLDKLVVGDKVYIIDDNQTTHAFVVREIRLFDRDADATSVFTSNDDLAHLNLITCEGIWNQENGTYPLRRVIFTDAITENSTEVVPSELLFSRSLSIGASGLDVSILQGILQEKGFLIILPTVKKGYFGIETRKALERYQTSIGLEPTGFFGSQTRAKIILETEVTPKILNVAIDKAHPSSEEINALENQDGGSTLFSFSQLLLSSARSLYTTTFDGIVTTVLVVLIFLLSVATLRNTMKRKTIERDLAIAKISALTVLKDLQAEKWRLAEAKAKDEALLESIGEGVVATDPKGGLIVINKVAEDLLQFTSQEIAGKLFVQEVVLEDKDGKKIETALHPIILAQTSGKSITSAYYFVRKDSTRLPVAITATPVLLNGKPAGAILVFRDISKEKEIEKLHKDFLILASHQLRTPLSGTKWLIETIQRGIIGKLNLRQKRYLDNLYQINERMIMLVSDMLNVLMLESGTEIFTPAQVSVSLVYNDLLMMMEPVAKNKGVILRNRFQGHEDIILYSDLQSLRSILECLVGNGINYSQVGQKVFFDATDKVDEIIFSVTDKGIGIPHDEQTHIFERFYRSSNAKKFKPDGTGLGLYTAKLLAQKIKGEIYFESNEDSGTTFYLRLPKTNYLTANIAL